MSRIQRRRQCTAGVVVLALAASAAADGERKTWLNTPRAEATRTAVLEWCEARDGDFRITNSRPFCVASDPGIGMPVLFMGEWQIFAVVDPSFWWKLREKDSPSSFRVGVLWLVDPTNPGLGDGVPDTLDNERTESDSELTKAIECAWARHALTNPAKVPVHLVGPAANECAGLAD